MAQGHFYNDPPVRQPLRYVPIPAQGEQPPRKVAGQAERLALASWPTVSDYPQQRRTQVAPLTLVYGDQPPLRIPDKILNRPWFEYHPPQQRLSNVAPLTLTYGDQPPRLIRQSLRFATDEYIVQQQRNYIAAFTADVVTFVPFSRDVLALRAWAFRPQLYKFDLPVKLAPLTLTYGDQPPRLKQYPLRFATQDYAPQQQLGYTAPFAVTIDTFVPYSRDGIAYRLWGDDSVPQQRRNYVAAFTVDTVTFVPYSRDVVSGRLWGSETNPQQKRNFLAPLALQYGDTPPKLRLPEYIRQSWEPITYIVSRRVLEVQGSTVTTLDGFVCAEVTLTPRVSAAVSMSGRVSATVSLTLRVDADGGIQEC